ncbi:MAG: nucleotidyl transferase AbiEii/AbiGii toxin family protein [Nitrospinae bacterium]|nr:nucleotidyl transferase AbiEii/AbiGii toxin family protein [Nitrospinota bacterium]
MINLSQILAQYPARLHIHQESILKEYLQCKILNSIFNSQHANKLAFLGGTALRIIYGSTRFSEDLDFDNFALSEAEFNELGKIIKADLELEGLNVEINTVTQNAYRLKIRIPKLLFDSGISSFVGQKILIQVDTVPQHFDYTLEKPFLNKFEIFTQINAVPKDLLLSQKIHASVNRKRIMGRDFFDVVFLCGIGAKPDFAYLEKNLKIKNQAELKSHLLKKTKKLDFEALSKDVEPLLFDSRDKKKVLLFRDFVKQNF